MGRERETTALARRRDKTIAKDKRERPTHILVQREKAGEGF